MKVDELRKTFLEFFRSKGHQAVPSDSLVPANDPTLLFTGAGMNQFKDYFLGRVKIPFKRATSFQKCLRTVDIEKVGRTAAHHTFFEMLGNFSFGDYFKSDAIPWAWEFLTGRLGIPPAKLNVSVYKDDKEAYDIWHDVIGLPAERIFKFDADNNFWPANAPKDGPNGPCGPCSEIFYDLGASTGCGLPTCNVNCGCNRFVEIWNLVFMEFDRRDVDELVPLAQKNIDTGMGLERIAAVMQGAKNNFEIDTFKIIIKQALSLIKTEVRNGESEARIRRIADHSRALVFLISDGVLPSNEGRGYVERRILRRAVRDGMTLGLNEPFIYKIVPAVVEVMRSAYPELVNRREHIARLIKAEEEKFLETVEQGMALLEETMKKMHSGKVFPGDDAFKLYDTYGFPVDLTESILREHGFKLDIVGYESALARQREQARAASKISDSVFAKTPLDDIRNILSETTYVGNETLTAPMKVDAILRGGLVVQEANAGEEIGVITNKTPFYAESGGQVGDTGSLHSLQVGKLAAEGVFMEITDTQWLDKYVLHIGKIKKGQIKVGQTLDGAVDTERHMAIARNHTATHLLQNALRNVIGPHIEQAGSLVGPDRFRFDFSHFTPLSPEEIRKIEDMVNRRVRENGQVTKTVTTLDDAKKQGALAFFGDKYGEKVRLVKVADYSRELCGGSHLDETGQIGYFRILSDSSIAAGTRRIEATTGAAAVKEAREDIISMGEISQLLGVPPAQAAARIQALQKEIKDNQQELNKHRKNDNKEIARALIAKAVNSASGRYRIVAQKIDNLTMDDLRNIADVIKQSPEPAVALLGTVMNSKVNMLLLVHQSLVQDDFNAIGLIKEIAKVIEGSGGGRKDLAQAGGKRPDKIDEAIALFNKLVNR